MGTLIQDLKFTLRSLRRAPAFPLAAIVTLALGIGATTAIFSTLKRRAAQAAAVPACRRALLNIRTTLTDGRVTTGLLSNGEVSRLNDPRPVDRAGRGLAAERLDAAPRGRHASAREGLWRHGGVLRIVRSADDARRLYASELRRAAASGAQTRRRCRARHGGGTISIASIPPSSGSRSALRNFRRRSPASRRETSTRRTAATSISASNSTRTTSIISSTGSCASSRARRLSVRTARWDRSSRGLPRIFRPPIAIVYT